MAWFVLKEGQGKHYEGATKVEPGVPFQSDRPLEVLFKGKFAPCEGMEEVEEEVEEE